MSATTKVIDLAELRGRDEFPAYAAIYSRIQADPCMLSPTAMRWSDRVVLARLEDCRQFWLNQKKKLRCKLNDLFDQLLGYHFGDDYLAVFGNHPWQCLWYLEYQHRHGARGLYLLESRLNRNIFKTLDWDCWFAGQDILAGHLSRINAQGFRPDNFLARRAQLQRFIERIGVATPSAMKAADANALTRRFGKWLGQIWQWSFTDATALQSFPWIKHEPQPAPGVTRDLEYPVNQWCYIEVLLREDLTRLCEQFHRDDCEHVNRMVWEITLFNYQKIAVELSFRHPYSLHRDLPAFDTALYQARYIYDDLMRKFRVRESDLDLPESMPFVSWRIEVCERILLAPQLWDLFASHNDQVDYRQIMSLQNKLPVALECYQADPGFYPEQSFQAVPVGDAATQLFDHYPWSSSAINKPLFFYAEPMPIEPPDGAARIFLERTSNQWWISGDVLQSIRDYYVLCDQRGRSSWAYRDSNGNWFKQGEYC
ncbi:MAG: hypothetical protein OEN02_19415 [Gammaproteobacteria bacterium]|nr:hypothetical protein [Gammaproteobacteria bacterium]MDH3534610.1 hypothetical protein [Gammaproteobacteria bacterium]